MSLYTNFDLNREVLSRNPAYSAMSFLRNGDDASAISRRARQMVSCLADYVVPASDNVGYLKLKDKGEIYFKNSNREGARSYDSVLDQLYDEAAFCENIQQIYAASSPSGALAGDNITKMIISTPSSKSGWYWNKLNADNGSIDIKQLCIDVADGKVFRDIPGLYWFVDEIETVKLIIHWKTHPVYSQIENYLEYRMQQDGTDWKTVLREYDLRFVDSAVAVFASDIVRKNATGSYEEILDKQADYYCGLDTATTGGDYCTMPVLKYKNGKYSKVHLYRKRQQTSEYHLYHIGEIISKYQPRKVGIEITGGVGTLYLEQLTREFPNTEFIPVRTTGDSKPVMISSLQLALEKGVLTYSEDSAIIDELLSFRREGKKLEAATGKHDDVIMGTAFALFVSPFNSSNPLIKSIKMRTF